MNYWQEKVTIGSHSYSRFIGGPLDGITDAPFRKIVRAFSPDALLYSEMRHVGCVVNDKTGRHSLDFDQNERPLSYQIAANDTIFIERACEKILQKGVDIIDLNIGCPARNVVRSGSGSALMADPEKLKRIVQTLRACVPIPLTIKIRAGFKTKNAVEIAQLLQDCGVDAIAIHPRLQTEFFTGRPDYALAAQVKKAVSIPVLLSGNVINWTTARLAYEQTGVDGFLIGRGIWAKPWKLAEMAAHAQGQEYPIDASLVFSTAVKHLDEMIAHYGAQGLYNFRKHLPFYLKGLPTAAALRKTLVVSESLDEVKSTLHACIG